MKNWVWALGALMILAACSGKKTEVAVQDSVAAIDTLVADTLNIKEAEEVLPVNADELFDDFIFDFSQNEKVQLARISFPLSVVNNGETTKIRRKEWTYDPLFANRDYYTILYNQEKEQQLEKDTALVNVRVEYLNLDNRLAKRYDFQRYQGHGMWLLCNIVNEQFTQEKDPVDFLDFYQKFANDSIFQREHVTDPLKFITFDPDDDFQVIETTLELDQWFAFRPELPQHELTNVVYGQNYEGANQKLICFRGCGNGLNTILTFQRQEKGWMLTGFEDTSE